MSWTESRKANPFEIIYEPISPRSPKHRARAYRSSARRRQPAHSSTLRSGGGPRSRAEVVQNAVRLVERFREAEAPVVLVRVGFSPDGRDALQPEADAPMRRGPLPHDWSELAPEIGPLPLTS
jgi:hypothetical protein